MIAIIVEMVINTRKKYAIMKGNCGQHLKRTNGEPNTQTYTLL
jgi:hypothetical protein